MEIILNILWVALQVSIGIYLVFPIMLYLFYSLVKKKFEVGDETPSIADYAIIVTAYEQTDGLHAVVASLLKLNYTNYLIYIVADKCDVSGLQFGDNRVIILRPPEALSSNTKSHFYAINHFVRPHNRLTIIDSDNLTDTNYLQELDHFFDRGFEAVQGVRMAKNLDTTLACLDAARDIYYHFYDGKILFASGSSATLAGSGMAFTTQLYKECLEHLDISGAGFDKVLQAEILKKNKRIAFAEKAIVYDEKTTQSDQLVNQRARWINTWFKYFKFGFSILAKGLLNGSRNQLLFGIVLLRPPLFIFLILSVGLLLLNVFLNPLVSIVWLAALLLFVVGFVLALQKSHTDKKVYNSLVNIPRFMFYQVISLIHSGKANKRSVATKHYNVTGIDDIKKEL
jgi:cellulose synthase/poly-beta-1,6-N-acetylglucosamine synthase-like glycosyltransferase